LRRWSPTAEAQFPLHIQLSLKATTMSFSISITHSTPRTRSVARMSFAAETVGPKKDSTGARPPNSVDITGTPPIKGITVTDAVAVSVTS